MPPFIAHISNSRGDCCCDLSLYRGVPGIHTRQPVIEGAHKGVEAIRQEWPAVDANALCFVGSKDTTNNTTRVSNRVAVARRHSPAHPCRGIPRYGPRRD